MLATLFRVTTQSPRLVFAPEKVLLKRLGLPDSQRWKPTYQIRQAVKRLEKRGLVKFQKTSAGWAVKLSARGMEYSKRLHQAEEVTIKKPATWDGRWRIVIFDIWERRRGVRDKLRRLLKKSGFYRVQNSVWVHPYDCAELVTFVRADMHLGQGILYIIADGIENDHKIREHFNLA